MYISDRVCSYLYIGGDHHYHDSTGAVLTMQRKIIAFVLNEEIVCVAFI